MFVCLQQCPHRHLLSHVLRAESHQQRCHHHYPPSTHHHHHHQHIRFVARACQYVANVATGVTGDALAPAPAASAAPRAARLAPGARGAVRDVMAHHRELLAAIGALDPAALARLQLHYAQAINGVLRRELRLASSELRRGAQADAAAAAASAAAGAGGGAGGGGEGGGGGSAREKGVFAAVK